MVFTPRQQQKTWENYTFLVRGYSFFSQLCIWLEQDMINCVKEEKKVDVLKLPGELGVY